MAANFHTLVLVLAGFFAGFVDAIVGGGGLISLPSLLALGFPPALAIGSNKAIGISAATASSIRYAAAGTVEFRGILGMCVAAFACSLVGAWTTLRIPPDFLRPLTFVLLIGVAGYAFWKKHWPETPSPARITSNFAVAAIGGCIGFYDGFFGPGTGTFLMVAFLFLLGRTALQASANSRVVNYCSNLGAVLLFATHGNMDVRTVLPASVAAFMGSLLGATLSIRIGTRVIRPVFRLVVVALIAKVGFDLFTR